MSRIQQSYDILEKSKLTNGMWAASTSDDYNFTWFRDTAYIALTFIDKTCDTYERAIQGMLDILTDYDEKLDGIPKTDRDFPHIRYNATTFKEVDTDWGHVQLDAYGAVLFAVGEGERRGKKIIRDEKDRETIQKLVGFLEHNEYHLLEDSGAWEEWREIRLSSIAAVVAGLEAVSNLVFVSSEMIHQGYKTLYGLYPRETPTRDVDLFQLTLIYPYRLVSKPIAQKIIAQVEDKLLREKGVLRYQGDSYYSTLEKEYGRDRELDFYVGSEAQWTFGFSYLALSLMTIGEYDEAKKYIDKVESVVLEDGGLPELYYSGDYRDEYGNNFNKNNPLIWSNAMFIQAKEMHQRRIKDE